MRSPESSPPLRPVVTRREMLRAGSLAIFPPALFATKLLDAKAGQDPRLHREMSCILLFLVGGPSHLDTWDMKPDAPSEVRSRFRPIATRVPGLAISEVFPKLAMITDKISLVRSLHHTAAAVHDTGHQMMQTGRLFAEGVEHPHYGSVVSAMARTKVGVPVNVVLPGPIGTTGGNMPHGQSAGYLGRRFDPIVPGADLTLREAFDLQSEPSQLRDRYGRTRFGENCLQARRLVERGTRFVTVNMYQTVFNTSSWDAHGSAPFSTLADYRDEVGPTFDSAYSTLIDDLDRRGLLESTMVLAFGEFGRTPRINPSGGRDHHPGCWTALVAGGPIHGGRIVGSSDKIGDSPKDRPVTPAEIAATIYRGFGIPLGCELAGPDGRSIRLIDEGVDPIHELF